MRGSNILNKAEVYADKYGQSPEQLFAEFEQVLRLHAEFEAYLKNNRINYKLNSMKRSKRSLERRKLFIEWYFLKNQNTMKTKEAVMNLADMAFVSERTVQLDLSSERAE